METAYSIGALTFSNNAGLFNLTNAVTVLTLTGGITNNSANTQILSGPVTLSGVQTFNAAAGNITLTNIVSGSGLTVVGANTVTLSGNNNYTGATTVNGGTLVLSGSNTVGAVTTSATLQLANTNALKGSVLTLNSGSTLQLRADTNSVFTPTNLILQNASDVLSFDVNALTSATGQTLSVTNALNYSANADQAISVTGASTYTLSLGAIALTASTDHQPYRNLYVNTLPTGSGLAISSVSFGNWGSDLNLNGGGKVTVTGNLASTSAGEINLFVNNATTATLLGQSVNAQQAGDGNKYDVANGTLILDNNNAITNNSTTAGLQQALFVLGGATNIFNSSAYYHAAGVLTATNNSFNASVYLGDLTHSNLTLQARNTNNVSDGDVGFTNSGVFTIGSQSVAGTNTYANPIILGWTANRGKSVTLVSATGGEVDFTGGILANGTDTTAGVTVGSAGNNGLVKIRGTANTYAGGTTVSNGTLNVSGTIVSGVTVVNGSTLAGAGVISNSVTVGSGSSGTLSPGATGLGSLGTLSIGGSLTLGSSATTLIELNKNGSTLTSDKVAVTGAITNGGVLTVTASGNTLAAGDSFTIFTGASFNGTFSQTNLPALTGTLVWNTSVPGVLTVSSPLPSTGTNMTFAISGSTLTLSWPTNYIGWLLQSNSVNLANTNYWFLVPGSAATNQVIITLNPANTNVFYRMAHP
jgi:autotransporter-associated beta strand protein